MKKYADLYRGFGDCAVLAASVVEALQEYELSGRMQLVKVPYI